MIYEPEVSFTAQRAKSYTTKELKEAPLEPITYLIDPIIPVRGVVLLHGKTGVGKTAFAVEEAVSVATGKPFLGLPTTKSRVAFLEIDTPETLFRQRFQARIATLDDTTNVRWIFFPSPFDCENQNGETDAQQMLRRIQFEFHPELVIVDTLRKVYIGNEKDGNVPSTIYGIFQRTFPGATIQFNAHDRKDTRTTRGDTLEPTNEDFSGHAAWMNDAQSGLHLLKIGDHRMSLEHTKSQYSELHPPISLKLSDDGCYVMALKHEQQAVIQKILSEASPEDTKAQIDAKIAVALCVSDRQARRLRTEFTEEAALAIDPKTHGQNVTP